MLLSCSAGEDSRESFGGFHDIAGLCMLSCFSFVCVFVTPGTVAHQVTQSIRFSGKNTGVGCHSLLQGIPDPGIEYGSPVLQANSLLLSQWGSQEFILKDKMSCLKSGGVKGHYNICVYNL